MQLDSYLKKHSITVADFAKKIGAKSRATVYRYITRSKDNKRLPDPQMMKKISVATNGEVTANDFYDVRTKSNGHG